MPRIPLPEKLVTRPFTTREGAAEGLSAKRMRGRDLQRPFRGVCVASDTPLSFIERCFAYQQRMPPHAFFCGPTAARIMGIPLPIRLEQSNSLHVAVPPGHRAPTGHDIYGHTFSVAPEDIRRWNGLRVSGPEHTWCTLGADLTLTEHVAAGDFVIHHALPLTSAEKLAKALENHIGRRGLKVLRGALPLLNNRSESPQESVLRVILIQGKIDGVVANLPMQTSGGFKYRADLAIPASKIIIEYQSRFHEPSPDFRADMTRTSRLEADGWYVMQVNKDDLNNPLELLQRIRTVLRSRK